MAEQSSRLRRPPKKLILTLYNAGLAPVLGRLILLLTTTGRKSGLPRLTPLQYECLSGEYWVGSARGLQADWVKNLLANPHAQVRVKNETFAVLAQVISEAQPVADFVEYRRQKRPRMIGAILKMDGLPARPDRQQLVEYAAGLAVVRLAPLSGPVPAQGTPDSMESNHA